ncbi:SDR family oxidoreductase [Stieleria mannarensis]|uniref:SDR family oxidoreductase n=1 Tax=Stieleria mannarensis TaxID=2755585 RepID=UPI001601AF4C|nr:SDR family oxidoreductase [Rhodopirellula sp. JC639]
MNSLTILVCGATGYVGGRLVRMLLDEGHTVRCLVRNKEKLTKFSWRDNARLQVHEGDLQDPEAIAAAVEGIDVAYYLVHSMIAASDKYAQRDRELAENFVAAVDQSPCRQIVYLGGLGELGPDLSRHLRSRREVAEILRTSTVPVTVLRAAMIIGSGSASFEILRYLVERLPIMVTPKWVNTETQPIAIRDVLRYLVECIGVPETRGKTLDIGGLDVMTYRELMQAMAQAIELPRRVIVPVPVLTPRLSSLWISLVTPVGSEIGRPLAEGLRNRTVCRNELARELMPGTLFDVKQALDAALGKIENHDIETRWSTAGVMPGDPDWAGGTTKTDERSVVVNATVEQVFAVIEQIGGGHGYWGAGWLWRVRGWMDQLVGGPGLRRGRRHPDELHFGEAVDFWRVTAHQPNQRLRLRAEMKLPGDAELDFQVSSIDDQSTRVTMTARFRPSGLLGLAYWYAVLPLHGLVFPVMLRGIKRDAEVCHDVTNHRDPASPAVTDRAGIVVGDDKM